MSFSSLSRVATTMRSSMRSTSFQWSRSMSATAIPNKKSLLDLGEAELAGKRVLMRVDFNVPRDKTTGEITDDTRIRSAIPSIDYLTSKGAKVVLCSHAGRPKGAVDDSLRLAAMGDALGKLIASPVSCATDCIGDEVKGLASSLKGGEVLLLDNLRFHAGETKCDKDFSKALVESSGAEVYVNDAFGAAHRAHSSTAGVVEFVNGPHVSGFLLKKELDYLYGAVGNAKRPFTAIVGGAKVSTKIPVLESLMDKCDNLIVGGAMIFTFYKARGLDVGASMVEDEFLDMANNITKLAEEKGVNLLLPTDVVVADAFKDSAAHKSVSVDSIPDEWFGLDVGPSFAQQCEEIIKGSKTILWNGPMGVFEWSNFSNGTFSIARAMAEATKNGAVTVVGGGDSVAAVSKCGLSANMSHISTGGGASLELLEGKVLPGVDCLDDK